MIILECIPYQGTTYISQNTVETGLYSKIIRCNIHQMNIKGKKDETISSHNKLQQFNNDSIMSLESNSFL